MRGWLTNVFRDSERPIFFYLNKQRLNGPKIKFNSSLKLRLTPGSRQLMSEYRMVGTLHIYLFFSDLFFCKIVHPLLTKKFQI